MASYLDALQRMLIVLLAFLATSCGQNGWAQDSEPPPLLKGGLVQQLRSLTEDALDNLRGEDNSPKNQDVPGSRSRSAGGTKPMTYPPQPSGRTVLQRTHASPWVERFVQKRDEKITAQQVRPQSQQPAPVVRPPRTSAENAGRPTSLADVVTPNQLLRARNSSGGDLGGNIGTTRQASDESGKVYIERELPDEIRSSLRGQLRSPASPNPQPGPPTQRSLTVEANSQANSARRGVGSIDSPSSATIGVNPVDAESVNNPPKVSRIPLPGTSSGNSARREKSRSADSDQKPARTDSNAQPDVSSQTLAQETPSAASGLPQADQDLSSRSHPSDSSASRGSSANSSLSVSVPTQLVAVPMAERAAKDVSQSMPPLPSGQGVLPGRVALPQSNSEVAGLPKPTITSREEVVSERSTQTLALPASPNTPQQQLAESPSLPEISTPYPSLPSSQLPNRSQTAANLGNQSALPPAQPRSTSSSNSERLRMETPRVQVVLNGPSDLPVGVPAEFTVAVRNDDPIDLQGLILRMDIPAGVQVDPLTPSHGEFSVERDGSGATLLTWGFEELSAGQTATAPVTFTASSARNFPVALEWTLMPLSGNANVSVRAPRLELALEGPSEVSFGEANTYRLRVRNAGDAVAKGVAVKLSAQPYGESSSDVGEIPAGGEEVIDVELTFNQKGTIGIAAAVSAIGDLASETDIQILVKQPDLDAEIIAPRVVYYGYPADYSIRVRNTGDADAKNLIAEAVMPEGAIPVQLPDGCTAAGRQLSWPIAAIAAGAEVVFDLKLELASEGENAVNFSCEDSLGNNASSRVATLVQAVADLKLQVSDPIAPAPVGVEVLYELELTNRGSKAASNVKVIAQFSDGIEPTRGEGAAHRIVPGQVFFEPLEEIGTGETIRLQVYAQARDEGMHRFRVEVRGGESEVRLVQEESTQFLGSAGRIAAPMNTGVIR